MTAPPLIDDLQLLREAVVAILDTHDEIVAITGRASDNLLPWQTDAKYTRPVVAYVIVTSPGIGGCGRRRRVTLQFSALAANEADANALCGVIERALTPMAFLALPTPLDAYQSQRSDRRGSDEDGRVDSLVVLDCNFAPPAT